MKRTILPLLAILCSYTVFGQCALEPFSLQKRTYLSDVIVEGRVTSSESIWNDQHSFIYTLNTVSVGKVFLGHNSFIANKNKTIVVITEGGQIGMDALNVEPALSLRVGEVGLFFIKRSDLVFSACNFCDETMYLGVASEQSFVKYDELTLTAHGYFEQYQAIQADLFNKVTNYTKLDFVDVQDLSIGQQGIKSLAAPVITSLSLDTLTSGTRTLLTINGSNFGIIQNKGKVEFLDPNFGDGRYFDPNYPSNYKSWSNSKIEVYVPSRAGTGSIRVTNTNNESKVSTDKIYVKFSHSNVGYGGTTGIDSGFYRVNHVSDNSKSGYTWNFNTKFASNSFAVNSFLRAAETWRCETLMNWDVGSNTTTDAIARDNENVIRFTKFGDSRLGVCYSWYNGCFNGGDVYWFVSEMDVDFDSTKNWYYGTVKPSASQIDFETVATHELGHGHQLSHVIDNSKIMHYSLSAGVRIVNLHDHDLEGGTYVRTKSLAGDPCGPGKYKAIQASECNITKPEANFTVSDTVVCPKVNITCTDNTKGKVNSYSWNFDADASTSTANTVGPHTLNYNAGGQKSIRLIVSNDFGKDTFTKTITVLPETPEVPEFLAYDDTTCIGSQSFKIALVADAAAYNWRLSGGGTIKPISPSDSFALATWITAGKHLVTVSAGNACGISAKDSIWVEVLSLAVASFDVAEKGLTIDFTNNSTSSTRYIWNYGDGTVDTTNHPSEPSHKFPTKGVYTVKLTASNICSDSTIQKDVTVNYGVGVASTQRGDIQWYPNPASNHIQINPGNYRGVITMLDVTGRTVLKQKIDGENQYIDIRHLPNGIFLLKMESSWESIFLGTLMIEH